MATYRSRSFPRRVANGRFEIRKTLGAGCFGKVYRAINLETDQVVAVKVEDPSTGADQLQHEAAVLEMLRQPVQPQGFAEQYYFGREGQCRLLVMEFLGRSLEDACQACGGTLNALTSALIAEQVIRRLEYLHSKGVVHQDIKPENFVWGVGERQHHLYLIDFGLSKTYWEGRHIRMRHHHGLVGTARYASINAHKGLEQSRRDDLEAAGHMLLYLLRGSLPWSGLQARNMDEKYKRILHIKETYPLPDLCKGFPGAFEKYLRYSRNLGFKERPDYSLMRGWFEEVRDRISCSRHKPVEDHEFEWNEGRDLGPLAPLQPWPGLVQPDDLPAARRSFLGACICGGKNLASEPLAGTASNIKNQRAEAPSTATLGPAAVGGA